MLGFLAPGQVQYTTIALLNLALAQNKEKKKEYAGCVRTASLPPADMAKRLLKSESGHLEEGLLGMKLTNPEERSGSH